MSIGETNWKELCYNGATMETFMKSKFAERLKFLRKEKGCSQNYIAFILGVSRSCIAAWEAKRNEADCKTLVAISSLFNVSVDFLLGITDKRN